MARAGRDNKRADDSHHCPTCDSTFIRREHLRRHLRSHTSERPFECPDCGKKFARMDVLNRHLALHDPKDQIPSASPYCSRACVTCAAARVRCSREKTCKRCSQRQLKCIYPADRDQATLRASSAETGSPQSHYNGSEQADAPREEHGVTQFPAAVPLLQTGLEDPNPGGISDSIYKGPCASYAAVAGPYELGGNLDVFMMGYQHEQAIEVMSTNWIPSPYQDIPATGLNSGYTDLADPGNPFFNLIQAHVQPERPNFADNVALTAHHNEELSLERQHVSTPVSTLTTAHGGSGSDVSMPHGAGSPASPAKTNSAASGCSKSRYYVDGAGGRTPFHGNRVHARANSTSTNDAGHTPLSLRATRLTNHNASSSQVVIEDVVTNDCLDMITRGIQAECELQSIPLDWPILPSLSQINELVRLYFERFNATFPFLPRSNLLVGTELDWILVLAMVAVAATYEPSVRHAPTCSQLPFLLRTVVKGQAEHREARDLGVQWIPPMAENRPLDGQLGLILLQARVLNMACMLRSGDQALMGYAVQERQRLVQCCRTTSLLSRADQGNLSGALSSKLFQPAVHREAKIKTGMMIWLLDCMLAYQQDCEPLMRLDDMQAPLPLAEAAIQTTTPEDGKFSLRAILILAQKLIFGCRYRADTTIFDVLEMLHIEKRLPVNLSELSNTFVIYAICSNLNEIFRNKLIQLRSWEPTADIQVRTKRVTGDRVWPPPTPLLSNWRNSACDCLDILHWRVNSNIAAAAGWENSNVLHLHFARLIILTPVSQVQILAVASSKGFVNSDNVRVNEARNHVLQWALHDHHKARLAIVHSGALLWHIRRFSKYSFFEPFAVYIAILVTWAYSRCHQQSEQDSQSTGVSALGVVSAHDSSEAAASDPVAGAASSDGESGSDRTASASPEPSLIQLDRPCDDEIVQAFVRRGFRMSAYMQNIGNIHDRGAPRKILLEGERLLLRSLPGMLGTSTASRQEERRSLGGVTEIQPATELEYSYARILRELGSKTPVS